MFFHSKYIINFYVKLRLLNVWFPQNSIFKFTIVRLFPHDICLRLSELCHSRKVISTLGVTRPRFLLNRKSPRSGRIGRVKVFRARKLRESQ